MVEGLAGLLIREEGTSQQVPHTTGRVVPASTKLGWGDAAPSQQQKELLGVKQYKNHICFTHFGCLQVWGCWWVFAVCLDIQGTKLTSKNKGLWTFDPSSLKADPMFFLNWNQEISWLCSPAG